jgi:hypothetical protein
VEWWEGNRISCYHLINESRRMYPIGVTRTHVGNVTRFPFLPATAQRKKNTGTLDKHYVWDFICITSILKCKLFRKLIRCLMQGSHLYYLILKCKIFWKIIRCLICIRR